MKRYIIFVYDIYYPCGGHLDIIKHEDDREAAITYAKTLEGYDNKEVYDCELEEVVWSN